MVRFVLAQIPNLHLSLDKCELPSLWTSPWQIAAQDPGPRIQHFRIPEPHHGPWRNKNSLSRLEIGMPANNYIICDGQAISKNARSKNIFGQTLWSERGRGKGWTQSQEVTQFFYWPEFTAFRRPIAVTISFTKSLGWTQHEQRKGPGLSQSSLASWIRLDRIFQCGNGPRSLKEVMLNMAWNEGCVACTTNVTTET